MPQAQPIIRKNRRNSKPPLGVFLSAVVLLFFCTLSAADSIGFVPSYLDGSSSEVPASSRADQSDFFKDETAHPTLDVNTAITPTIPTGSNAPTQNAILPSRIIIGAIELDLTVQNPTTRDLETLDALLQNGPARYVDSAGLGESGNMIIFAHSSHLPIVHNQMFKAFNKIPDLSAGDSITIVGKDGKRYLYSVNNVHKADASNTKIDLSKNNGTRLTLVTCDTLTSKSARFVLEADFVGTI